MAELVEWSRSRGIEGWAYFRLSGRIRTGDLILGLMLLTFLPLAFWAGTRNVLPGDVRFTRWVQGLELPALGPLTDLTNWSMSGVPLSTVGALAVALLIIFGRHIDGGVLAVLLVVRLGNGLLKLVIESPRPSGELVQVTDQVNGFGHPSGHASGALLITGALAWILTRNEERRAVRVLVWTVALAWIALTGIGRIRSGAHWPTDVASAWLWTFPVLVMATRVATRVEQSRRRGDEERAIAR